MKYTVWMAPWPFSFLAGSPAGAEDAEPRPSEAPRHPEHCPGCGEPRAGGTMPGRPGRPWPRTESAGRWRDTCGLLEDPRGPRHPEGPGSRRSRARIVPAGGIPVVIQRPAPRKDAGVAAGEGAELLAPIAAGTLSLDAAVERAFGSWTWSAISDGSPGPDEEGLRPLPLPGTTRLGHGPVLRRPQARAYLGNFEGASRLLQNTIADSTDFLEARLALATLFREKYQASLAGDELGERRPQVSFPSIRISISPGPDLAYQGTKLFEAERQGAARVLEIRPRGIPRLSCHPGASCPHRRPSPEEAAELRASRCSTVNPTHRDARALLAGVALPGRR